MQPLRRFVLLALAHFFGFVPLAGQATGNPRLTVRSTPGGQIEVTWPTNAPGFTLEARDTLFEARPWQAIAAAPGIRGTEFTVLITPGAGHGFFRLRRGGDSVLTTVRATSPINGETGVAVTRETILHFSAPLSSNAIIGTNFYATFGGRRLLSRTELSSDRTKATLFYLEPLPGSARVTVAFNGSLINDAAGIAVDANGDGIPGGQALMSFETLSLSPLGNTAVIGTVYASELAPGSDTGTNSVNKPLAGVTITVDGREQDLRAVTDTNGNFKLSPAPSGRFFVHIDGRTVTNLAANIRYPDQAYYPFVGKAWDAVAGREDNLAGGTGKIYLPLITAGTLQPVSMTRDTPISFPPAVVASNPALAGVAITVPANSLFADDGTRGGKVGIAPVAPDRLPGPLPAGVELPLVITVQTDGPLNFDQPAPICFPNLPHPTTGRPWPPGTKGSLISFNHKKGAWEEVGDMTVSADGKFFCTDPGVGILQPGWHGPLCPKGKKSPPRPPDCPAVFTNDPEKTKFDVNNAACDLELMQGLEELAEAANAAHAKCNSLPTLEEQNKCHNEVFVSLYQKRADLYQQNADCKRTAVQCFGGIDGNSPPKLNSLSGSPVARSGRVALQANDPIRDGILQIEEQIRRLLESLPLDRSPLPPEVLSQLISLGEQASAIVGTNAVNYLTQRAILAEEQTAAAIRELGIEPDDLRRGNAPPYPVFYRARILRPTGVLDLRGETEPYGQYTLFVPPDGELLNVRFYDPKTKTAGLITPNLSPQARYALPRFSLYPLSSAEPDSDRDGLPDRVEEVYGTNPSKADSDADGIPDGAEVEQGTNPLDGFVARTGVIATVKLPGSAIDIVTGNDLAVLAEGPDGVALVNISKITQPTIMAQVDTPGTAQRVAFSGQLLAVADGTAGLAVIDVSDPVKARIIRQVELPAVQAVAAGMGLGYAGLNSGAVVGVDLLTGEVLGQVTLGAPVQDLALEGDHLYGLTRDRLYVISLPGDSFKILGSAASPFTAAQNVRLFVGNGLAYTVHRSGYNTLDVKNPGQPVLLAAGNTTQFGWRQIVANGSGLGLAAVGPNSPDSSPRDVSLYDLSEPRATDVVITTFPTPGNARAVSIYRGLVYVADDTAGMQVINYLAYDANGTPPTVAIHSSVPATGVVERTWMHLTATAADDVQVRNVEFYADDLKIGDDGNFPFELGFQAPNRVGPKTNMVLRARAVDSGGNAAWSDPLTVPLLADTTPPQLLGVTPIAGAKVVKAVHLVFNETIDLATLTPASFRLIELGADGLAGTPDDLPVSGGSFSVGTNPPSASLQFPAPLPLGRYQILLDQNVKDLSGNSLAPFSHAFRVANVSFWASAKDGEWNNPANWSDGVVPGADEEVVIDVPFADPLITAGNGIIQIRGLTTMEPVRLEGTDLRVANGIDLGNKLTLDGATLRNATVSQREPNSLLFVPFRTHTLDNVRVIGDFSLSRNDNMTIRIRNGFAIEGTLFMNFNVLHFMGDQAWNTGTLAFGGSAFVRIDGQLTLGPNLIVRGGSGTFSQGAAGSLINQGLISSDVGGRLIAITTGHFENRGQMSARNRGFIRIESTTWTNSGTMEASGNGDLALQGDWHNAATVRINGATLRMGGAFGPSDFGVIQRTGGNVLLTGLFDLGGGTQTLDATTGSWTVEGGTIKNGTVVQTSEGRLQFAALATNNFDAVKVIGDLGLTTESTLLRIRNGLTIEGTVSVNNRGALEFVGNQSWNSGAFVFGGNTGFLQFNGELTLGSSLLVHGQSGTVRALVPTARLINQGTIAVDVNAGQLSITAGQFANEGLLKAQASGSILTIRSANFINTGTTQELNGGQIRVNP